MRNILLESEKNERETCQAFTENCNFILSKKPDQCSLKLHCTFRESESGGAGDAGDGGDGGVVEAGAAAEEGQGDPQGHQVADPGNVERLRV